MSESGQDPRPSKEEEAEAFRQEQLDAARAQGMAGANAVPDRRPAGFDVVPDSQQSDTYLKLREAGLINEEPMGKEAYDKASSDAQHRKAAREERLPEIHVSEPVQIVIEDKEDKNYVYDGKYGAILQVQYKDVEAERIAAAGTAESRFAPVDFYTVKLRDGRNDLITVKPGQIRNVSHSEMIRTPA